MQIERLKRADDGGTDHEPRETEMQGPAGDTDDIT